MPKKVRIVLIVAKHIGMIFLDVLVMITATIIIISAYFYQKTPLDVNQMTQGVTQTSVLYDRTGEHVLYEIHGEENRKIITHDAIPDSLRLTTIAAEDDRFYSHSGIDLQAVIRAFKTDVQSNEIAQGGSTITQQLARNALLTRDKTLRRKILEVILALKIERKYNKDEILDMYLNQIPYGSNAYGTESASETFFGKSAKDLSLDESAVLAALPNAPTTLSPYGNHIKDLVNRKNKILSRMAELKYISNQAANDAIATDTMAKIVPFHQTIDSPHFVFYVKEILEQKYGKEMVEKGGFKVYTTLDYDKQKLAENIIGSQVPLNKEKYKASNAALVAIDPKTGQILTMVGSKDYFDKSIDGQVNVATSPRQPGSSFKPFAYATAFEKGYQPENYIFDTPTNFGPDGSGKDYMPHNYDGKFHGLVTMRQALAMSLNVPAVKTLYLAGVSDTIDTAHRLGITTLNQQNRYGLALVLGGGEVYLLDETAAFSVFANDGKKNTATAILKIVDAQGNTFYQSSSQNLQVLDPQIARKINSILSDNSARTPIFGPNNKLFIPGRQVAAKTGTTQEFHDAWTVGYTPSIAVGVWAGNNDNAAMNAGADGSYVAAPIWNAFMSKVLENYPQENFTDYDRSDAKNISRAWDQVKISYFDKNSGDKVSEEEKNSLNPADVGIKIKYQSDFSPSSSIVDFSNPSDPMLQRWQSSIGFNENKSDSKDNKDSKKKKHK